MRLRISLFAILAAAVAAVAFVAPAGADDELSPVDLLALYQPVTVLDRTVTGW